MIPMTIRQILISIAAASSLVSTAFTLNDAKEAFAAGNFAEAAPTLKAAADREPKNADLNAMAGEALFNIGKGYEATKYFQRGGATGQLGMANYEFYRYHFDAADEWLEKYFKAKYKDDEPSENDLGVYLQSRIELGRSMFDRVEKIAVIDSFTVDADNFFRIYKLSAPAGSVNDISILPDNMYPDAPTSVYATENKARLLWGAPDSIGDIHLYETSLLADGSWEKPRELSGAVNNENSDANFPYLMSDGITLYYASNDPDKSLGGYDIFITRNDGEKYLEPQNIGMPYNSPYDDYLLAIDEVTGAGWWASDRNRIPGKVTVYLFAPSELRINYSPDTPNLSNLAMLSDIAATRSADADFSKILQAIEKNSSHSGIDKSGTFTFNLPDGTVIHHLDQFHSEGARNTMESLLELRYRFNSLNEELKTLRQQFADGDSSVSSRILELERQRENMRREMFGLANSVIRAEMPTRNN